MSIVRSESRNDYVMMSAKCLREKELSLKAKGLYGLLLSIADDCDASCKFTIDELCIFSKDGKHSVLSAINELKQFGYIGLYDKKE